MRSLYPAFAGLRFRRSPERTFYGHEIEMYTVEQGEKRDKRQ